MPTIDADTHVYETEDTWEFMDAASAAKYKPTCVSPANPDPKRPPTRYWMVEGRRRLRFGDNDKVTGTTVNSRELLNPEERVRHMDALGIDVHVIYPTIFLVEFTENPECDLALRRSYNRWLADRCSKWPTRLRWVCLPPLHDMAKAIEELRFAKQHGACGVLKKGDLEAGKWPNDPYFFPLYEEAERLDMPICFHLGCGTADFSPAAEFTSRRYLNIRMPVVSACYSLIEHGIPAKFPKLRWGFIEVGAMWIPQVIYNLQRVRAKDNAETALSVNRKQMAEVTSSVLRDNNIFVTAFVEEDLPYLLDMVGEDIFMVGSDYGHADYSREMGFEGLLLGRAERGEITASAASKMLDANPRKFYGL